MGNLHSCFSKIGFLGKAYSISFDKIGFLGKAYSISFDKIRHLQYTGNQYPILTAKIFPKNRFDFLKPAANSCRGRLSLPALMQAPWAHLGFLGTWTARPTGTGNTGSPSMKRPPKNPFDWSRFDHNGKTRKGEAECTSKRLRGSYSCSVLWSLY